MNDFMYWKLRYRMFKAVRNNVFGIAEGDHLPVEAVRLWNFLFPEMPKPFLGGDTK